MKNAVPIFMAVIFGCLLVFSLATEDSRLESRIIGVTAKCNDGSYTTTKRSSGVCSSHGGVNRWIE